MLAPASAMSKYTAKRDKCAPCNLQGTFHTDSDQCYFLVTIDLPGDYKDHPMGKMGNCVGGKLKNCGFCQMREEIEKAEDFPPAHMSRSRT